MTNYPKFFDPDVGSRLLNAAALASGLAAPPAIGGTTPAAGSFTTLKTSSFVHGAPTVVAAAGATQGNAGVIPSACSEVVVTVTASTEGVRLPVAVTGKLLRVWPNPTVGNKVYPATNALIGALATNASMAVVKNKPVLFYAVDATHWRVMVGA